MNATDKKLRGWPCQLHLDLSQAGFLATGISEWVQKHTHAITSKKIDFHAHESQIGEHTFSIKLSYLWRSFLVKGNYRRERLRSYADPTYSSVQIRWVHFDTIQAFRNDRYMPELLSKTEVANLETEVHSLLANPFFNTTLAENETVH